MNTVTVRRAAFGAAIVLAAGCSSGPELPQDQLASIARDAYVFTYPLVMNYRTMYKQAIADDGAFGRWRHAGLATPADTDIVTPNNDTPYSYAWVDLRVEPWVLTLPRVEPNRFYTSQWDDLWGFVVDNAGSVPDGNGGGNYLLAAPSWQGQTPPGIKRVIRGESSLLGTLTRTQLLGGPEDLARVKDIQQKYTLQPLSQFMKTAAPPALSAITWPRWSDGDETREAFWNYAHFLLPFVNAQPADVAMLDKLATLGLTRGTPWRPESLHPTVRAALQQGIDQANAEMKKRSEAGLGAASFFGSRERIGTDYMSRAMGVYMGIFGNVPEVSVYFSMPADAAGQPLDGSKAAYTLTFAKGQVPPVKYFWSITMYSIPQRLLVENPMGRYSIGSNTSGLKTNPDGSLVIQVSADSPGKNAESNWLPAPRGPFWMVLRSYGPDESIVSGPYKPPAPVAKQ